MFRNKDYVLEIYRTGSFSKAASNLFISQSSLSLVIKRLETKIGDPLFDRSSHPIKLTECGKKYVQTALDMNNLEENFLSFLDDYRNLKSGTITIGGSGMNLSYILPSVLKKYKEKYPHIHTEIVEGNIDDLKFKLMNGDIDLLIDSCDVDPETFRHYLYLRENLLLIVPKNLDCDPAVRDYMLTYHDILENRHLDPAIKPLPLNLLGNIPFIALTPETDTYQRSAELCRYYSYTPNTIMSFNQQATAFNIACAGLGATLVSDELVKHIAIMTEAPIMLFKVLPEFGTRYIRFYSKKSKRVTYAMKAFITMAQSEKTVQAPSL